MADLNRTAFRIVQESTEPKHPKSARRRLTHGATALRGARNAPPSSPPRSALRSPARPPRPAGRVLHLARPPARARRANRPWHRGVLPCLPDFPSDGVSIMVSMNRLSTAKRAQVIGALVEGNSIRATVRMTGVAKNTITKLIVDLGEACSAYQDAVLRDLDCESIQCDEMWSFCYAKQRTSRRSTRTSSATATCGRGSPSTPTRSSSRRGWWASAHGATATSSFATSRAAWRAASSSPPTAMRAYRGAIPICVRGPMVDWAQVIKKYALHAGCAGPLQPSGLHRRSQRTSRSATLIPTRSAPATSSARTSPCRMGMRRFTRLTNAFSKKVENLSHAVSLHYMHYNFARVHSSLTITDENGKTIKRTPAMAAGVADHVWTSRKSRACSMVRRVAQGTDDLCGSDRARGGFRLIYGLGGHDPHEVGARHGLRRRGRLDAAGAVDRDTRAAPSKVKLTHYHSTLDNVCYVNYQGERRRTRAPRLHNVEQAPSGRCDPVVASTRCSFGCSSGWRS